MKLSISLPPWAWGEKWQFQWRKQQGFKDQGERKRDGWVWETGGGKKGCSPPPHSMLISSFSFLLPRGIRMILFKVSAWATGLRNLDFIGIIITEKMHTHKHTHTHSHTHSFFSSLSLTNDLLDQQMIFILKFSARETNRHCDTLQNVCVCVCVYVCYM